MTTASHHAYNAIVVQPKRLRWQRRRPVSRTLMLALALGLGLAVTACQSDTNDGDAQAESSDDLGAFDLPTQLDLQAGATTDVVIGSFAGDVSVTTSGAPEGVTATIASAGDATTITFDVAADAPRGTYSIDVTASGAETMSETLQFTIVD
jgi:hypothetical protein